MGFQALIFYGDGSQALFYQEKNPEPNLDGVMMKKLLVSPEMKVRAKCNLTERDLHIKTDDGREAMWVEYPVKYIHWLNRSNIGGVIFILCAFDGSDTEIMHIAEGLLEYTKVQDRDLNNYKALVSRLQHDLHNLAETQAELFRQQKSFIDIVKEKPKEDDEEEK